MIGEKIKKLRREFELSQKEFAQRIGITQGFLSDIEGNKKNFNSDIILNISREFNIDMNEFLSDSEKFTAKDIIVRHNAGRGGSDLELEVKKLQVENAELEKKLLRAEIKIEVLTEMLHKPNCNCEELRKINH